MSPAIRDMVRGRPSTVSLHELSRRAEAAGYSSLTQSYLWKLEQGNAKGWPKNPDTIRGLALVLDTTPLAVVLGYAAEFGLPVDVPVTAARLPLGVDDLPARSRDALVGMAQAMVADHGETAR